MGTGPWPQPPTEAEQLQALMAAANGESFTFSFSLLLCPFSGLFTYLVLTKRIFRTTWFSALIVHKTTNTMCFR